MSWLVVGFGVGSMWCFGWGRRNDVSNFQVAEVDENFLRLSWLGRIRISWFRQVGANQGCYERTGVARTPQLSSQ